MNGNHSCLRCVCRAFTDQQPTTLYSPLPIPYWIPACGPAAQAAPTDDVVRLSGNLPDSLIQKIDGQPASKQGSCPSIFLDAVWHLVRVAGLIIDEAEPIHVQHQEPDEMVLQITSIEDLRWAVMAVESALDTYQKNGGYHG